MNLRSIDFGTDSNGDAVPQNIAVTMSLEEAILIARLTGRLSASSTRKILGATVTIDDSGIYDCLIDGLFNRYWDDGVDGAHPGGQSFDVVVRGDDL